VSKKRKSYSNQFKFKVALEATQGLKTLNEIASQYNLHPNLVRNWKKKLMIEGPTVFSKDTAQELWKNGKQNYTSRLGDSRWNLSG
jgi:putative transposase